MDKKQDFIEYVVESYTHYVRKTEGDTDIVLFVRQSSLFPEKGEVCAANLGGSFMEGKGPGDLSLFLKAAQELKSLCKEGGMTTLWFDCVGSDGRGDTREKVFCRLFGAKKSSKGNFYEIQL